MMTEKTDQEKKPDKERVKVLKSLPPEIVSRFSKEEVNAFLFDEVWPDSLQEKLKDYLV